MLHYIAADQEVQLLAMERFPVGLLPSIRFQGAQVHRSRGDLLVLASDGILEVTNETGKEFGLTRLADVVRQTAAKELSEIYDAVTQAVRRHGRQEDDQTLLLARVANREDAA
jgi:serine phosphatase RsbU (regulator of sigma subunit)